MYLVLFCFQSNELLFNYIVDEMWPLVTCEKKSFEIYH